MQKLFLSLLLMAAASYGFAQVKTSVLTQHNDTRRTGWNNKETVLTPANVSTPAFGLIGNIAVDDQIYAQPLVVGNLTIGSFTGSVVFVATVNNSVYAFNADDVSTGIPLWQTSLTPTGQRPPDIFDLSDSVYGLPCFGVYRDFSGKFGIVGTPVIDTTTFTLYVVTKTIDNTGKFAHYINAIDIRTGASKAGSPKKIAASVSGTGDGSINGVVNYDAKYANQRPALLLYNKTIYIASASHCDWGPFHGWVLGYDATTLNLKYAYNTTPNGGGGGIWMAGQGITVGDDGNLYVVTGNGTTGADTTNFAGGRSESLIKLSPQLQMLDWYTPTNYDYLDNVDLDYGSDGALMIPNSSVTVSGSKEGISYVVDYNRMGKITPGNVQVKDTLEFNPRRTGYVHVHGSPVYAQIGDTEYVYAWAETFRIRQHTFNRSTGTFSNDFKQGYRNLDSGMPGAMLSVSSNGTDSTSGVVWACFPFSGNANQEVRPGTMAAFNAKDIRGAEIWNTDLRPGDGLGKFAKFNNPTPANGKVYTATFSNRLKVYGLKCSNAAANLVYANGSGLKGEYYTNSGYTAAYASAATITRTDEELNFTWGYGSPDPAISKDVFKVKWSGTLQPLTNDTYTIYFTGADGVRLWINDQLMIDSWTSKLVTTNSFTLPMVIGGSYKIYVEYYSHTNAAYCILQWSASGVCKQSIPKSQLFVPLTSCAGTPGDGLIATYYSNTLSTAPFPAVPSDSLIVPMVNFDWGAGSPTNISIDNFKARFTGFVQTLNAGTYTFYTKTDNGVRLWINNQLVIDKWISQGTAQNMANIYLDGCTKYPIKIEYNETSGPAVCKLEWSSTFIARQAIPTAQLFTKPDATPLRRMEITAKEKQFGIYPNPVSKTTMLHITTPGSFLVGDIIAFYNEDGQVVKEVNVSSATKGNKLDVPVNMLTSGIHILRLIRGNGIIMTGKVLIIK